MMEIKTKGAEDILKDLDRMAERLFMATDAVEMSSGEEDAEQAIRARLALRVKPRQIPLMSEEEALEAMEDEAALRASFLAEDIADFVSEV